ncbi:uncharacterized protein FFC1_04814 [Fusarium fujikuroi]
MHHI